MLRAGLLILCFAAFTCCCFAQDERTIIKKSLIPATGTDTRNFIPTGWKLEEQLSADLDGDGTSDYVLKLIEKKPAKNSEDVINDRARALVVLLQRADGTLWRAAIADKLLQCTGCGGAFYGFVEAPANVKIEKNVIVVEQDHGSREVADVTFRFRYDPASQRFMLAGFDYSERDRANGKAVSESTNYLTGVRKTNGRTSTIMKTKVFIDDVDYEKFEEDAGKRLGLG
ncbi:MAG: hypothetical protein ABR607_06065 [Pyrinomonadaceae bacterium]